MRDGLVSCHLGVFMCFLGGGGVHKALRTLVFYEVVALVGILEITPTCVVLNFR